MTARDEVLGRIRTALALSGNGGQAADLPGLVRAYRAESDLSREAMLDRLTDRLRDYGCTVRTCDASSLTETVATALSERGAGRVVVPAGLEVPVRGTTALEVRAFGGGAAGSVEVVVDGGVVDGGLSAQELDQFDGVVTTATLAIAETGTIVLDGSARQGRRALTLVPDYHLCVLYADQVVGLVPEAVAALDPQRPLTWISGPSATSDIELDRVQGVHGPRTLEVILVTGRSGAGWPGRVS